MGIVLKPSRPVAVSPRELTAAAPIVVLAPHPDDESLGCGALLAHAFGSSGAHVVCMTDGAASHPGSRVWPPQRLSATRKMELECAVHHLGGGARDVTWLGYPDGWLGAQDRSRIVSDIVAICRRTGSRRMFAPAPQDHHEDHKSTAAIASGVADAVGDIEVFSYPVWSRWDDASLVLRIAMHDPVCLATLAHREAKRAAIAAHRTQVGGVILDDPAGFTLPAGFVDLFVDEPELFWRAPV